MTIRKMTWDLIDEHVAEVQKLSHPDKQRYTGVVTKFSGTTFFIQSGERQFLAFAKGKNLIRVRVGDRVTFWIEGLRARDIEKIADVEHVESTHSTQHDECNSKAQADASSESSNG